MSVRKKHTTRTHHFHGCQRHLESYFTAELKPTTRYEMYYKRTKSPTQSIKLTSASLEENRRESLNWLMDEKIYFSFVNRISREIGRTKTEAVLFSLSLVISTRAFFFFVRLWRSRLTFKAAAAAAISLDAVCQWRWHGRKRDVSLLAFSTVWVHIIVLYIEWNCDMERNSFFARRNNRHLILTSPKRN